MYLWTVVSSCTDSTLDYVLKDSGAVLAVTLHAFIRHLPEDFPRTGQKSDGGNGSGGPFA